MSVNIGTFLSHNKNTLSLLSTLFVDVVEAATFKDSSHAIVAQGVAAVLSAIAADAATATPGKLETTKALAVPLVTLPLMEVLIHAMGGTPTANPAPVAQTATTSDAPISTAPMDGTLPEPTALQASMLEPASDTTQIGVAPAV